MTTFKIRFYKNIPFLPNKVRNFSSDSQRETYLNTKFAFEQVLKSSVIIPLDDTDIKCEIPNGVNNNYFKDVNYMQLIADGSKYFYFIEKFTFNSSTSMIISRSMDYFQTYNGNFNLTNAMLEREMSQSGNYEGLGFNVEKPNLLWEYNYYKMLGFTKIIELSVEPLATEPNDEINRWFKTSAKGTNIGRWQSSTSFFKMTTQGAKDGVSEFINFANQVGETATIVNCYLVPSEFIMVDDSNVVTCNTNDGDINCMRVIDFQTKTFNFDKSYEMGIPETYEFNKFYLTSNSGDVTEFDGTQVVNSIEITLSPPPFSLTANLKFNSLQGENLGNIQAVTTSTFPILYANIDVYANYIAQNANSINQQKTNIIVNTITSAVTNHLSGMSNTASGATSGAMTGGTAGAVGGAVSGLVSTGISQVKNLVSAYTQWSTLHANLEDAQKQSFTSKTTKGNNVELINSEFPFFMIYRVSPNSARVTELKEHFSIYGYKSGKVKKPTISGTERFYYVKTKTPCITGIPLFACIKLNELFMNGCWVFTTDNMEL